MIRFALSFVPALVALPTVAAAEWVAVQTPNAPLPAEVAVATDERHSRLVENPYPQTILRARYALPTTRYPHGALGDDEEWSALDVQFVNKETARLDLPDTQVFEDEAPRIVDLDGFGRDTIVTILSSRTQGAAVALARFEDGAFRITERTPFIGTPNRWLNIAGIDDFDGSGSSSIAVVRTPHIGGTLEFWRWSKGKLAKTAEAPGFSNHEYGVPEQRLSAVEDFDDDGVSDLALPSADRRALKLVRLSSRRNPKVETIAEIPFPAPIDKAIAVRRAGDAVVLTVGLSDGTIWSVTKVD